MNLVIKKARAYIYCGEWVGDCPRDDYGGCSNVEYLFQAEAINGPRIRPRPFYVCSHCGFQADIQWPRMMDELMAVLALRPVPDNRNWYPKDHPVALRFSLPHGQTVRDLQDENAAHGVPTGA